MPNNYTSDEYYVAELKAQIELLQHDVDILGANPISYKGHYVYKYVLDDEIIYVGKTDADLSKRLNSHGKPGDNIPPYGWNDINRAKIYYAKLLSKRDTDIFESELIRRYKPKYNKAKQIEWDGVELPELHWSEYKKAEVSRIFERINDLTRRNFLLYDENRELKEKLEIAKSILSKYPQVMESESYLIELL